MSMVEELARLAAHKRQLASRRATAAGGQRIAAGTMHALLSPNAPPAARDPAA